mmetsp:Transcript_103438/g.194573  ORF Transcript_103438/g.194573 Transcript_103438/m.194573 type:complete len:116 (-) Transcript_103438:796-1143(-)
MLRQASRTNWSLKEHIAPKSWQLMDFAHMLHFHCRLPIQPYISRSEGTAAGAGGLGSKSWQFKNLRLTSHLHGWLPRQPAVTLAGAPWEAMQEYVPTSLTATISIFIKSRPATPV